MPPSRRAVRAVGWLVWPVVAAIASVVVGQASYASFSAKVSNGGNSFSVGSVVLGDDDSGSALFSLSNLKPGDSGSRCLAVTSTGSLPSLVRLYATDASSANGLGGQVALTITQGTGGGFGSCSGFVALKSGSQLYSGTVAGFTGAATSYATGLGSWAPTGTAAEGRSYQLVYTVSSTIPDSAQGGTAAFSLTWEAQNT